MQQIVSLVPVVSCGIVQRQMLESHHPVKTIQPHYSRNRVGRIAVVLYPTSFFFCSIKRDAFNLTCPIVINQVYWSLKPSTRALDTKSTYIQRRNDLLEKEAYLNDRTATQFVISTYNLERDNCFHRY